MCRHLIRAAIALLASLLLFAIPAVAQTAVYDVTWSTVYDYAGVTTTVTGTATATFSGSLAIFQPWSTTITDPTYGVFSASGLGGPGQFITLESWPVPFPSELSERAGSSTTTFTGPGTAPTLFTLFVQRLGRLTTDITLTGSETFSASAVLDGPTPVAQTPEPSLLALGAAGLAAAAMLRRRR